MLLFFALSSLVAASGPVSARIVPEVEAFVPGEPFAVAIELSLERGWHTYWTNPGDSGMSPSIEWKLPPGWSAGELELPTPARIVDDEMVTFGYEDRVTYVATLSPPRDASGKLDLEAELSLLVCKEVCLPVNLTLRASLPAGQEARPAPEGRKLVEEARSRRPVPLDDKEVEIAWGDEVVELFVPLRPEIDAERVTIFPAETGVLDHMEPIARQVREEKGWRLTLRPSRFLSSVPERFSAIVVPLDEGGRPATRGVSFEVRIPRSGPRSADRGA